MTYDGVPGGFAFITDGGMAPTIGPGGTPGSPLSERVPGSAGCATVAAGAADDDAGGGGLGSAQAAATTPTAITLIHVRVTSASLPSECGALRRILNPAENCKTARRST